MVVASFYLGGGRVLLACHKPNGVRARYSSHFEINRRIVSTQAIVLKKNFFFVFLGGIYISLFSVRETKKSGIFRIIRPGIWFWSCVLILFISFFHFYVDENNTRMLMWDSSSNWSLPRRDSFDSKTKLPHIHMEISFYFLFFIYWIPSCRYKSVVQTPI